MTQSPLSRQGDFTGGELAPNSYGKTDSPAYQHGLRTALNFIATLEGQLLNRPGTRYVAAVKNSAYAPRLVSFTFADGQNFVLELGDGYMRIVQNGAQVMQTGAPAWNGATNYTPGQWVTDVGHQYYANLPNVAQEPISNTPPIWVGPFNDPTPYEIGTPWAIADVMKLKCGQSGDIITVVHPSYPPQEITRISNTNWTVTPANYTPPAYFGTQVTLPAGGIGTTSSVAINNLYLLPKNQFYPAVWVAGTAYVSGQLIRYLRSDGYWAQYISTTAGGGSTGKNPETNPTYWVLHSMQSTATQNGVDVAGGIQPAWANNDYVYYYGKLYISLADNNIAHDTNGGGPDFTPNQFGWWVPGVDSAHPAQKASIQVTQLWRDSLGVTYETLPCATFTPPTTGGVFPLATDRLATYQWGAPNNAVAPASYVMFGHAVYRGKLGGVFGLIGTTDATTYTIQDNGAAPDFAHQPPRGSNPFDIALGQATKTQSWPGAFTYHEQRAIYGRSNKRPQDFWGSAIGKYKGFDVNTPVQDSDSFNFRPASEQLEDIRNLLSLRYLLIFTGAGLWGAYGPSGQITPSGINLRRYNQTGCAFLSPLALDKTALYLTTRGRVYDANWDWRSDMYVSRDVSVIARHMVEGHNIVDWCYAQAPYSIVWAVRDDGALLSLTYAAGGVEAWARHSTAGTFERTASVSEADPVTGAVEDAVYVVARRMVAGAPVRYIERFSSRIMPQLQTVNADLSSTFTPDVRTTNFLDCSIQYDGRNTNGANPVQLSGGVAYAAGEHCLVTSSLASFTAANVGDSIVLEPNADNVEARIIGYNSTTQVQVELLSPLTAAQIAKWVTASTTSWGRAQLKFTNLAFLNGQQVNVLADGVVAGPFTVVAGAITLGTPGVIVQIGIGYNSDLELLDLAADQFKTNVMSVKRVTFEVVSSRGILIGETFNIPTGKTKPQLVEPQLQEVAGGNTVPKLFTGQASVYAFSSWNIGARACLRQSDPLPLTVVAAVREVVLGGRG